MTFVCGVTVVCACASIGSVAAMPDATRVFSLVFNPRLDPVDVARQGDTSDVLKELGAREAGG